MIILGIDPGTASTGFGIVKSQGTRGKKQNCLKCIDFGCIKTKPSSLPGERLCILQKELQKIIKKYRPDILAIEDIFFFKNLKTAISVSQAEGIVLFAAAKNKIPAFKYTPLQIKQAITSYGRAEKIQMQRMVKFLLNLEEIPRPDDAADALATAICASLSLRK